MPLASGRGDALRLPAATNGGPLGAIRALGPQLLLGPPKHTFRSAEAVPIFSSDFATASKEIPTQALWVLRQCDNRSIAKVLLSLDALDARVLPSMSHATKRRATRRTILGSAKGVSASRNV